MYIVYVETLGTDFEVETAMTWRRQYGYVVAYTRDPDKGKQTRVVLIGLRGRIHGRE